MWAVGGLEPFPTQISLQALLMFQISVSGETMHISLPALSAPPLPLYTFPIPQSASISVFSLSQCVSLLFLPTPPPAHFPLCLLLYPSF